MRKFFMFFIILGIIVGSLIEIKNYIDKKEIDIVDNNIVVKNSNIMELNLAISEIDTLNPLRTKNSHVSDILKLVYEPLVLLDEQNQIEEALATSVTKKDDLTWIITLRENVTWHGGEVFSCKDVEFTINTLQDNLINSVYASNVKNIKSIDVVDDQTIVIVLNLPDAYFMSKLTFPILPHHYFKNEGMLDEEKANRPVGTGAYKFATFDENKIVLEANELWWNKENIKLKKINLIKYATYSESIKGFKSAEVDMILTTMHNWKENFGFIGINSYTFERSEYEVLIPNTQNKILKDTSVRRAILLAINRENIVSEVYEGNATIQDIPISSTSKYASTKSEYDLEKAKQILLNAGWIQKR